MVDLRCLGTLPALPRPLVGGADAQFSISVFIALGSLVLVTMLRARNRLTPSVIKPERLAFASDYPHEMSRPADYKAYLEGIQSLGIPESVKMKILGEKIRALFKL
ncbi:MAG TPA: hypothetical protein VMV04_00350 [Thermodesulfobacteriota bacterium]|nr:hypothetical protein [Thermodesulfobacteriota bacterium]